MNTDCKNGSFIIFFKNVRTMVTAPHPIFDILNNHFPHHREMTELNRNVFQFLMDYQNHIYSVTRQERCSR